jgi:hypothetical protein
LDCLLKPVNQGRERTLRERQDRIEKDILQWREKQAKKNL